MWLGEFDVARLHACGVFLVGRGSLREEALFIGRFL